MSSRRQSGSKTAAPVVKKTGRPPFEPTQEQRTLAMLMTASGHLQRTIAERFGIDTATLRKHFRAELDEGREATNAAVGDTLLKKALAGDIKAIENWFDRRGGPAWQKKTGLELAGPNGEAVKFEGTGNDAADFTRRLLELAARRGTQPIADDAGAGGESCAPVALALLGTSKSA